LSSPALAQNTTLLTCLTPPWGLKYDTANVTLSVFHGEQEVANRDAAPKAQLPPILLSQSCLTAYSLSAATAFLLQKVTYAASAASNTMLHAARLF
jgi:hypothetical protein